MTRVGVLVAAYRATYLDAALRSALGQTHSDLEVLVVDDSPDDAVRLTVERLGDRRLRYLRNETNLGPAGSYGRALRETSTSVVGVLNDDDVWEPTLVERLLSALESDPDAVLAFADHWVMVGDTIDPASSDAHTRHWTRDTLDPGRHAPFTRLAVVDKAVPLAVAALFRRDALPSTDVPPDVGGAYDLYISALLSRHNRAAVYVPDRLASWRTHGANLTAVGSVVRAKEGVAVYGYLVRDPALVDVRSELRAGYANALWTLATRELRTGSRLGAIVAALRSMRHGRLKAAALIPAALLPRRWVASLADVTRE